MMIMRTAVPNRPAISDVLLKASANNAFCRKLLVSPREALAGMDLSARDAEVLTGVQAPDLRAYAQQVKTRLPG